MKRLSVGSELKRLSKEEMRALRRDVGLPEDGKYCEPFCSLFADEAVEGTMCLVIVRCPGCGAEFDRSTICGAYPMMPPSRSFIDWYKKKMIRAVTKRRWPERFKDLDELPEFDPVMPPSDPRELDNDNSKDRQDIW